MIVFHKKGRRMLLSRKKTVENYIIKIILRTVRLILLDLISQEIGGGMREASEVHKYFGREISRADLIVGNRIILTLS
jgi:hypothetical protein